MMSRPRAARTDRAQIDLSSFNGRLRQTLQTDPVLTVKMLGQRRDLWTPGSRTPDDDAIWAALERDGFARTERVMTRSVGARVQTTQRFVCASKRVAELTSWNLRQLAGLAATRAGLGISPTAWKLRALERSNRPLAIPDAEVGVQTRSANAFNHLIALEWDSGSATRSTLAQKITAYAAVAPGQLWLAPTIHRAVTLHESLSAVLPAGSFGVLTVDWCDGLVLAAMLPHRGSWLELSLARVMPVDAPWGALW